MTRFALRDVFLLTLVVGMGVGWWLSEKRFAEVCESLSQTRKELSDSEWRFSTLQNWAKSHQGCKVEVIKSRRLSIIEPRMGTKPAKGLIYSDRGQ